MELKFKNVYPKSSPKPLFTNIKADALCKTRLKANMHSFMYPHGQHSISVLSLDKKNASLKITLHHTRPINNFNCSNHTNYDDELALVVSSCRNDSVIRVWDVQRSDDSTVRESPNIQLLGHQGRIEYLGFHPAFSDVLASSSSDGTIKIWSMSAMNDKVSLNVQDDSFVQSLGFDYMGERLVSITSKSLLQVFDPKANSCSLQVKTQHTELKSARVTWLHPDPLIVSTGFDKRSNRTLLLWDLRKLDKAISESSFGSSFAQLEPIWDFELPILYLSARNENLAMMELKNGLLYQTSVAKMDKTASCLELLPKSLCDTSKCEIARFLRLGSDQSVDTIGINVPRINSDIIFQQDLYPNYSLLSIKDSNSWFDPGSLNSVSYENPRVSNITSSHVISLANHSKVVNAENDYKEGFIQDFTALLKQNSWWILNKWVKVCIYFRNNIIYISDSENNSILVADTLTILSFSASEHYRSTVNLKIKRTELLLQLENESKLDQFIDAISRCTFIKKSLVSQSILERSVQFLDPFNKEWQKRFMVLAKDAMLLIYDDTETRRTAFMVQPLKFIDLHQLCGIFKISISSRQCPSGSLCVLPIFIFRLVFTNYHYVICTKTEHQLDLWIHSILGCLKDDAITDTKHLGHVKILETASNTKDNIHIQTGGNYTLFILSDMIQFSEDTSNSLALSITRSSLVKMKKIDHTSFLLFFNDNFVKVKIILEQEASTIFEILKHFMSQNGNFPSTIGINSDEDLNTLMNESPNNHNIIFSLHNNSYDGEYICLVGFGNQGDLEAFEPTHNSIYSNKSYVLETKNEIFYWNGPNSKRRIHAKALELAVRISKHRNLRPKITLVERDDPKTIKMVFSLLGSVKSILSSANGPDLVPRDIRVLQINSHAKHISSKIIQISISKRLSKAILNSKHVYIVLFQNLIFLWIGSISSCSDKINGRAVLRRLANLQKEKSCGIGEFVENQEHPLFWEAFDDAAGPLSIQMNRVNGECISNIAHSVEQKEIDLMIFQAPLVYEDRGKDLQMVDIRVFQIANFRLEPIPTKPIFLRSSESYVFLYLYNSPLSGVTKAIAFFWQGSKSAITEQGAAAMLTIELSTSFNGQIIQERVEEGKESIQFGRLLGGINILNSDLAFPVAFDIRSNESDHPCKSYQISDFKYIPWNINHAILFLNNNHACIWKGEFCLQSEIDYAKNLAAKLGIMNVSLHDDFDKLNLAGLGILKANKPPLKSRTARFKERFYQTLSITGAVDLCSLQKITESDLKNVVILDNLENIYIWINEASKPLEITTAILTMQKLIISSHLHLKSICFVTFQGHEPFDFKSAIHGWMEKPDAARKEQVIPADEYLNAFESDHLDRTRLESYLDHESFANIFQMTREEYNVLPLWKRNHLKKCAGFF